MEVEKEYATFVKKHYEYKHHNTTNESFGVGAYFDNNYKLISICLTSMKSTFYAEINDLPEESNPNILDNWYYTNPEIKKGLVYKYVPKAFEHQLHYDTPPNRTMNISISMKDTIEEVQWYLAKWLYTQQSLSEVIHDNHPHIQFILDDNNIPDDEGNKFLNKRMVNDKIMTFIIESIEKFNIMNSNKPRINYHLSAIMISDWAEICRDMDPKFNRQHFLWDRMGNDPHISPVDPVRDYVKYYYPFNLVNDISLGYNCMWEAAHSMLLWEFLNE